MGGCDQEGGPPQIGPCIAQRGGTVCSTAFGSLTGVFFGTFLSMRDSFSSVLGPVARGWRRGCAAVVYCVKESVNLKVVGCLSAIYLLNTKACVMASFAGLFRVLQLARLLGVG